MEDRVITELKAMSLQRIFTASPPRRLVDNMLIGETSGWATIWQSELYNTPTPITSNSNSSRDAWDQLVHLRSSRTCRSSSGKTLKGDPPEGSNSNLDWRDQFFRLCSSAPVVIFAARLGVGRTYVSRHRDHSYGQHGQEPEGFQSA